MTPTPLQLRDLSPMPQNEYPEWLKKRTLGMDKFWYDHGYYREPNRDPVTGILAEIAELTENRD